MKKKKFGLKEKESSIRKLTSWEKKTYKIIFIPLGIIFLLMLIIGVVAALTGDNETNLVGDGSSTEKELPDSQPEQNRGILQESDERCKPYDATIISAFLQDNSLSIANGQSILDSEGNMWIGATLLKPDGTMQSRSDVWVQADEGGLFAVTSGARLYSTAPRASDFGFSPGDEESQALNQCVINLTLD